MRFALLLGISVIASALPYTDTDKQVASAPPRYRRSPYTDTDKQTAGLISADQKRSPYTDTDKQTASTDFAAENLD
ncbi:hypothetical protein E4U55_005866 [Claviceps digitariae]|nr:hypothetical protein E4U55_005866 [Claviceps digitariae]